MAASIFLSSVLGVGPYTLSLNPYVTIVSPVNLETDVASSAPIIFTTHDDIGVDLDLTVILVSGTQINTTSPFAFNAAWSTSTVVANATKGYDFVLRYSSPFFTGTTIPVVVTITDTDALLGVASWSFTIYDIDKVDPVFYPFDKPAWDFPLRFEANGNLSQTTYDKSIEFNIRNAVQIYFAGIPLRSFLGSRVHKMIFDPLDTLLEADTASELIRAITVGEPRVLIDPNIRVKSNTTTGYLQLALSFFIIKDRTWQLTEIDVPYIGILDKTHG